MNAYRSRKVVQSTTFTDRQMTREAFHGPFKPCVIQHLKIFTQSNFIFPWVIARFTYIFTTCIEFSFNYIFSWTSTCLDLESSRTPSLHISCTRRIWSRSVSLYFFFPQITVGSHEPYISLWLVWPLVHNSCLSFQFLFTYFREPLFPNI